MLLGNWSCTSCSLCGTGVASWQRRREETKRGSRSPQIRQRGAAGRSRCCFPHPRAQCGGRRNLCGMGCQSSMAVRGGEDGVTAERQISQTLQLSGQTNTSASSDVTTSGVTFPKSVSGSQRVAGAGWPTTGAGAGGRRYDGSCGCRGTVGGSAKSALRRSTREATRAWRSANEEHLRALSCRGLACFTSRLRLLWHRCAVRWRYSGWKNKTGRNGGLNLFFGRPSGFLVNQCIAGW